jgi:excinuclease ABC subunit A
MTRTKSKKAAVLKPSDEAEDPLRWLIVRGARQNNLKNVDAAIPLGRFVCVTGVSGSGKSSLVNDIIREQLSRTLNGAEAATPGVHEKIEGVEHLDKVIDIDQSPIGRTPRSNPATYTKLSDEVRDLFAKLPDSKLRGYAPGRFSFNVSAGKQGGGRCEACEGNGANRVEMDFLADVWAECPVCEGRRFNHETLQVRFKGKNIHDVLQMDVQEAMAHFEAVPKIHSMLKTLHDVGLDYIKLGQSSTTLSGGEAQRIKLARELVKRATGRTLYILDEPTTGLHFEDIRRLLAVLHGFVDSGNSVIVIEHNLDVIKTADWVIDLGPEGGAAGGRIVAEGTPEEVAACAGSYTGEALCEVLGETSKRQKAKTPKQKKAAQSARLVAQSYPSNAITVVGAREHNLKDITVSVPRGAMTVCSGVSGSGKSSFAIDTVYTEGQRRYVESLSAYARQFLGQLQKPKVDHVYGLSPAISIEQKTTTKSPRSTVGTVTEIYDNMRVLWARIGQPHCPACKIPVTTQTSDEIVDRLMAMPDGTKLMLCAPVERSPSETWENLIERCRSQGYTRIRIGGEVHEIADRPQIDVRRKHEVELVVDRIIVRINQRSRIADSVEHCLTVGRGLMITKVMVDENRPRVGEVQRFSQHLSCERCGTSYDELTPHHFSFNARIGWCPRCEGLGVQRGTRPDSVIVAPDKSILEGGIAGWERAQETPLLKAMLIALARAIGFDPKTPCSDLTAEQRHSLLFGLGEEWIAIDIRPSPRPSPKGEGAGQGMRFQWKGFFPAIDEATRVSWQYRNKLQDLVSDVDCQVCAGGRVQPWPAAARLGGRTIVDVCSMPLSASFAFFDSLKLAKREARIAGELLHEIKSRLRFLLDVGLDYLSLGRAAPTLSGGESQRIRLASQIGSGLTGVLYVLDEPTIGLHPRDNARLIGALHKLRDLGNTLLMVEHDREVIAASDHLLDFGPGAGAQGGYVVAAGTPAALKKQKESLTGQYLANKAAIPVPTNRREVNQIRDRKGAVSSRSGGPSRLGTDPSLTVGAPIGGGALIICGARHHNLHGIDVALPLGRFTCITGVSGSGKSSLITEILYPALASRIHRARMTAGAHEKIEGIDQIDKVINVDQHPIGESPLSNPATYCGIFDLIRELFARLPDAKIRGYTVNRFSFNRAGGRCEACEGQGQVCHEMHFLPDVWVTCDECGGARYQKDTLEVRYKSKNISDVLNMTVSEAMVHFENIPELRRMLKTLEDVGLGYIPLGQSAPTLSGGEAQRVKLAAELGRPSTGKTMYILDEPTTGLHFDDLRKLLDVLHRLVDLGNTVVCIEHNLDVIKTADWVIDLGPDAGDRGGRIVAEGTPEDVAKVKESETGKLLRRTLEAGPHAERQVFIAEKPTRRGLGKISVPKEEAAAVKMPWQRDGRKWHLEQRPTRDGQSVEWESAALEHIVRLIEKVGKASLLPTDWNDRVRIEICAKAPEGVAQTAVPWFLHALTGGRWLLDVYIRVPEGTFKGRELNARLGLKPLNDREDIHAYGNNARVQVRPQNAEIDHIHIQVHDKKEIATGAFDDFLRQAVKAYVDFVAGLTEDKAKGQPWKTDGKAWHLSQKQIPHTQPRQWKPADLAAFIGRMNKLVPGAVIDYSRQVFIEVRSSAGSRVAKIVTHQGEAIRVDVSVSAGTFTPTQVERLGFRQEVGRAGSGDAGLSFWFKSLTELDTATLSSVLRAAGGEKVSV